MPISGRERWPSTSRERRSPPAQCFRFFATIAGSLLFTGGGLALAPSPEYTALSVGKAGLRAFAQALHTTSKAQASMSLR